MKGNHVSFVQNNIKEFQSTCQASDSKCYGEVWNRTISETLTISNLFASKNGLMF